MKIKFARILGVGVTLALLASLLVTAVPAAALSQPQVSVANPTISATTTYTIITTLAKDLAEGGKIVINFPSGTDLTDVGYSTGTATFTQTSTTVTGTGTSWTTSMAGATIINNATGVVYTIASVTNATTIVLTAVYAEATAAGVAYTINPVLLSANAGIGSSAFTDKIADGTNIAKTPYASGPTLTITVPDVNTENKIGLGAMLAVKVAGVKNPNTAGDYTLTLGTTTAADVTIEAAVTSGVYTIYVPGIAPLPGIVERYNSAGVLMEQQLSISTCITNAIDGDTIKVGPGTYDEDLAINKSLTIQSTSGAAVTTITDTTYSGTAGGQVVISFDKTATKAGVVFDGFTVKGNISDANVMTITGLGATVKNCVFTKAGLDTTTPIQTMAVVAPTNVPTDYTYGNTITKCSFDTTLGSKNDIGVDIQAGNAEYTTVSDSTFLVDTATAGDDKAIQVADNATLSGNTITGSSGTGIVVTAAGPTVTVSKNTLKSLTTALNIAGGSVTVKEGSIEACGSSVAGLGDAIEIGGGTVKLYGNTIKDSAAANYAMDVAAGTVYAWFNNITGNAYNIKAVPAVDARHNWWGAATGPAAGTVTAILVTTTPVAGASISAVAAAFGLSYVDASTTVGLYVSGVDANGAGVAMDNLLVAKYSANPQTVAPTIYGTGKVLNYYDVFYCDPTAPAPTSLQIKFYGAVTSYTKIYYGGALSGMWASPTSSGVNVAAGYAYVTVTAASSPSLNDLTGTPFALVDDKTTSPPTLGTPAVGAYLISITPTYAWGSVVGAIRYEIALSEDPTFAIVEWSYNVNNPFYKDTEELKYNTTYYWRVRGVLAEPYLEGPTWKTPATPWATGIFTTEKEPVVEEPQEIVVPPSEVTVEIPPTKITVESPGPFIPEYILWVIVAVGAILIIALIVLIVRTRRAV